MYFNVIGSVTFLFLLYSIPYIYRKIESNDNHFSPPEMCFIILYILTILAVLAVIICYGFMFLSSSFISLINIPI